MTINVVCQSCEAKLKAPDDWAGKKVACPKCKTAVVIPAAGPGARSDTTPKVSPAAGAPSPRTAAPPSSAVNRPKANTSAPHDSDEELFQAVLEGRAPVRSAASTASPPAAKPAIPAAAKEVGESPKAPPKSSSGGPASRNEVALQNLRQKRALLRPEWLAWLWLLLFVPLVLTSFMGKPDITTDLMQELGENPHIVEQLEAQEAMGAEVDRFDLLKLLPGKKLKGAMLSVDSLGHWGIAFVSALFYAALIQATFRFSSTHIGHAAAVAIFTGTAGILLLLGLQMLAVMYITSGVRIRGGIIGLVIQLILAFIAFTYRCAIDPEMGFLPSLFGFTFGVGLCEELCKAIPIIWMLRSYRTLGWRGAAIWGLASGVGFGLSEAISYSGAMYNGLLGSSIYWVRFLSCVGLHSMWAATVAIFMWRGRDEIEAAEDWTDFAVILGKYMFLAMLLHGLYDTLLKAELDLLALLVAIFSFFVFIFVMHNTQAATRGEEHAEIF